MKNYFKRFTALIIIISFVINYLPTQFVFASAGFDLTLKELSDTGNGKKDVSLDWDEVSFTGSNTQYYVARKNVETGEWELRGNYSSEKVRVLNVYPDISGSDGLESWMETLSDSNEHVNISVDKVKISSFNSNPTKYLVKNSDGTYNYDVIVFGFWDSFNGKDISSSASNAVQSFIDNGHGVIFGHDTVQHSSRMPNFTKLIPKNLSLVVGSQVKSNWIYSQKIKVKKQGTLTTYPFDITGQDLTIPMSHTVNQIPTNPNSIYMSFVKNYYPQTNDGPYFNYNVNGGAKNDVKVTYNGKSYDPNAYLISEGNVSFIQCGHTSGSTNPAEKMVLANVIYAMSQITLSSKSVDQMLDVQSPTDLAYTKVSDTSLKFTANDVGSNYVYRIIATPVGYSVKNDIDAIKKALDNDSASGYGSNVKFSQSRSASVKGGFKQFNYYVDKKTTGEIYDGVGTVLGVDETLTIPTAEDGLTNDMYLHIAPVDRASNFGESMTLNVWDLLPDKNVEVNYFDKLGDKITDSVNTTAKIGTSFSGFVKNIENYIYDKTLPSTSITVSENESENVLNHYYDTFISKDIYRVEHLTYPENKTVITKDKLSVSNALGSSVNLSVPTFDNFTFSGYYTVGSETDNGTNRVDVSGNSATVTWTDETPLYVHYDKKAVNGTVNVVDAESKKVLASYTKKGHVGDTLVFSGDEIKSNVLISDIDCYTNPEALGYTQNISLTLDESKNVSTIELKPRVKQIIYYGVDYNDQTRARVLLDTKKYVYDGVNKTLPVEILSFDSWTLSKDYSGLTMDFTKTNSALTVEYYKGNPPNMSFDYKVNYYDVLDSETPIETLTYESQLLTTPAEIDFKDDVKVNVAEANRLVDYDVSYMVVTDPNGLKTTLNNVEEYNSCLPTPNEESGVAGSYTVDIYYKPIVLVNYKEYLLVDGEKVLNNETNFNVNYNTETPYQYSTTKPLDEYTIEEVVVDGVALPNPKEYDFKILADDYNETVEVTYKAIPYLTKEVYRVDHSVYPTDSETVSKDKYKLSNLYGSVVKLVIPSFDYYTFKEFYTVGSAIIDGTNKVDVLDGIATIDWTNELPIFIHYDKDEVTGTLKVVRSDTKEVLGTMTKKGHINDVFTFTESEIKANISDVDYSCYQNSVLDTVMLPAVDSENIATLELKPRTKLIVYYGVDYSDPTRAKQVLGTETFVYDGINKTLPVEIKDFSADGWTPASSYDGLALDFSQANGIINVAYYKGNPPQISFNYDVNYYDILNTSTPLESLSYGDQLLTVPADIDLKNHSSVQVDEAGRLVDFDISYIEITDPDNIKTTLTDVEHYNEYIPSFEGDDNGKEGHYEVDIFYKPIVKIDYKEYTLDDNDEKVLTNEVELNVAYNKDTPYQFNSTKPLSENTIEEVTIDGVAISNPQDFDFNILADDYNKEVCVTYKPIPYIEKKIYRVEHLTYPVEKEVITSDNSSLSYLYGTKAEVKVPTFDNFTFKGYYTVGSDTDNGDNKVLVTGDTTTIDWNDDTPIYLHYDKKVVKGTVNVKNSVSGEVLGTYSKNGHTGDVLSFTGQEIKDNTNISDLDCYENATNMSYSINVPLQLDESLNVGEVSLNPRKKQVVYYGIDYNDQTRAKQILETNNFVYDGISKTLPVEIKTFAGWAVSKDYSGLTLDFTKSNGVVYVEYYKGNPPDKSYNYDVNYINLIDDSVLGTISYESQLLSTPSEIDFKNHSQIQVDEANRLVDFEVSYMVITDPDGIKTTLEHVEEYGQYLPAPNDYNGKAGAYTVDIYYKPLVKANYKEYVLHDGEKTLTNEVDFDLEYNEETPYQFSSKKPLDEYEVNEVIVDGNVLSNPQDFDFSILADKYNKTIEVTYKPITYDLIVEAVGSGYSRSYIAFKYTNVPLKQGTVIDIPEYKGYSYNEMKVADGTPVEYLVDGVFKPDVSGVYKVNLYYSQSSEVTTHYLSLDGTDLVEPKVTSGFVGDDVILKTPSEVPMEYELAYGYMDSVKFDDLESGHEYSFTLQKPVHTANLYYKKAEQHKLNVLASEGGEAFGDGQYFDGQDVGVMAWADEKYIFDKWTVEGDSGFVLENPNEYMLSFSMPSYDVTLKANFIEDPNYVVTPEPDPEIDTETDPETDVSTGGDGNGNNVIIKKPIIEVPKEEVTDNDGSKSTDRLYKVYIEGYPDNTVRPNNSLRRDEVVQIIYNLFGDGQGDIDTTVLNKFSDVNGEAWYTEALAYCVQNGVVSGYADGTFNPEGDVTREELAVILAKFLDEDVSANGSHFTDVENDWSRESIERLYTKGIVKGYKDDTFKPSDTASRAEFVTLVNRLINRPLTFREDKVYTDLPKDHWAYQDMMNASNGGIVAE